MPTNKHLRARPATTFGLFLVAAAVILCPLWVCKQFTIALTIVGSSAVAEPAGEAPKQNAIPNAGPVAGVLPVAIAAVLYFCKCRWSIIIKKGLQPPAPPAKAPRIDAFDSIRFFLIAYIASGHFITFAAPSAFAYQAITQINVVVGAFFCLSGYVAAYTGCEIGKKEAKARVVGVSKIDFILPRIFGYWPLHMFILIIFSPMFLFVDLTLGGILTTLQNAFLSVTMTSAWFPMKAEVWNAPTWFLGALTFATILMPFYLPAIAKQGKKQLRSSAIQLTLLSLMPKVLYCWTTESWGFLEGALSPKAYPSLFLFNLMRFCPIWAVFEVMLGVVACRLVMLDGTDEEEVPMTSLADTALPMVGMIATIILRAMGIVALSDMIVRPLVFLPLFLLFLMGLHRASIQSTVSDPIAKILAARPLTFLGGLSFPIFVVHGPLGQLFYKKVVATKVFGGPMSKVVGPSFFYKYLIVVVLAAYLLNKKFMSSKSVASWSKSVQTRLASVLGSFL